MNSLRYKTSRRVNGLLMGLLAATLATSHIACAATHMEPQASSTPTVELAGLQDRFGKVADSVTPSIVAISAIGADIPPSALMIGGNVDGPQLAAALDRVSRTVGTGFVIDTDGYILTAEHVVSDAEQLWITTDDRKVYPAMVVGSDPRSDMAVLKIPAHNLKPVTFAAADSIKRGQWTLTLGNPYGLATGGELSMSVGVVSATNRSLSRLSAQENRLYTNLIQTTAEINPGNSGGPLFDLDGRVIGMNAAVVLPQKNTNGIGFAFAINDELLAKVKLMKAGEPVQHAYLGVSVSNTTANSINGARIDSVIAGGPSSHSGLGVGDVVTQINDEPVGGSDAFARVVSLLPLNKPATLKVIHDGAARSIAIKPGLRPSSEAAVCRSNQKFYWGGMLISAVPEGYRVQSISPASSYRKQGIDQGAIITGVAGKKAANLCDLLAMISTTGDNCKLDTLPAKPAQHASAAP